MANDDVQITMTREEVARRWAADNGLAIIDWPSLDGLVKCYQAHGDREVVFNPPHVTYFLRDKEQKAA
jgi:hypothetical protein